MPVGRGRGSPSHTSQEAAGSREEPGHGARRGRDVLERPSSLCGRVSVPGAARDRWRVVSRSLVRWSVARRWIVAGSSRDLSGA